MYRQLRARHLGMGALVSAATMSANWFLMTKAGMDKDSSLYETLEEMPTNDRFVLLAIVWAILPYMARKEEEIFRYGTGGIVDAVVRSVIFGVGHSGGLRGAISTGTGGLVLTAIYKKRGLEEASMAHLAANTLQGALLTAAVVALTVKERLNG